MNEALESLYREVILDHHRSPRGARVLESPDAEASGKNPSCGDEVTLQMSLDGDIIEEVGVVSHGCAISTASGSMLAELIEGKTLAEAGELAGLVREAMHGEEFPDNDALGDLEALEGVKRFPMRVKCALLPWITLLEAIIARAENRAPIPLSTEDD